MVGESLPNDEEFETYIVCAIYVKYPEYKHSLRFGCTCPCGPLIAEYERNVEQLDETERKYLHCIKLDLPRVFKNKFKSELLKDMEQNPFRIFFWLKQKYALEMTRGRIIYYWTVAIKNKLK